MVFRRSRASVVSAVKYVYEKENLMKGYQYLE